MNYLMSAKCRQKPFAYIGKRDIEFEAGDSVYFNNSSMKRGMGFCRKGKLSRQNVVPYEILK